MEEQNRLCRQHRHDLKNHLSVLSGLAEGGKYAELADYLARYRKAVYSSMITVDTGLEELDILLYSKIASAHQRKIHVDFKCSAAVNSLCVRRILLYDVTPKDPYKVIGSLGGGLLLLNSI